MLINESRVFHIRGRSIEIMGVQFHWREASKKILAAISHIPKPSVDVHILLAHDPRYFRWLPHERFSLVLSGHTHGGQVAANMFGIPISLLGLLGLYDQGLFKREDCRLYVHKGNWNWGLPPRMGVASEIVLFEI